MKTSQRARTDEQKAERRSAILGAAAVHLRESGAEGFSMAHVGKQAGVAKGTLYLYFQTREELLLELHDQCFTQFLQTLLESPACRQGDESFATALYCAASQDELLLPLMSRLAVEIEHNVTTDLLVAHKRNFAEQMLAAAIALSEPLELSPGQAREALTALGALLLGAAQLDVAPKLASRILPKDVRAIVQSYPSAQALFVSNAQHILRGIRGSAPAID